MKKAWQIASILFVVASAIMMVISLEYPYKDRLGPGPGFFPFWLGIIGISLGMSLFIQVISAQKAPYGSESPLPNRLGARRIAIILVALGVSAGLLDILGFRITLFLFFIFLLFALGIRSWFSILLYSIAGSFGVFHIFYHWLKVPLPMGFLGF